MKYTLLIIMVTALLLAANANAALIDNDSYTTDTASGLDWLDLSITTNQSYDDALINNSKWRYATNSEVENLFSILFPDYYVTTPTNNYLAFNTSGASSSNPDIVSFDEGLFTNVVEFQSLFGPTLTTNLSTTARGFYRDEDNILRMMGTYQDLFSNGIHIIWGTELTNSYSTTQVANDFGTYLVRNTVVPIPSAVWLFGSGLLGLLGFMKRKSHV